ncbi:MAG: hypothetical protein JOZ87_07800 [Chloroflexi bacterium]|nr:hypothetical protein [Chloroflexota bacterium]
MAGKADFTEAEWQTLEKGVTGAGMLVALADPGFFDSFKETGALAGHLNEARQNSSSQLVRDLGATHSGGFGIGTSPQALETGTLEALRSAVALLRAKAPDETSAYSDLVLGVADSVAKAVSGVAPSETAAIDKIKSALQTT